MLAAFAGALVAFAGALASVGTASSETQIVYIWRLYGFGVFAGLFLLLAIAPQRYVGIWELVIANKAALAVTGLILLDRGVPGASTVLISDGALALMTLVAYVLAKGYSGWQRRSGLSE